MRILRIPDACAMTGDKRAGLYAKIKSGLITRPVKIGPRAVGLPDTELEAINRARVAGESDDAIRELVVALHAERNRKAA